jgi:predicted ATPase
MYLKSFVFAETDRDVYPHSVMAEKDLGRVEFAPVTIFYGGNGSGKSTVLNVIARTIDVRRMTEGNTSDYFRYYTRLCDYESSWAINSYNTCFIRSEDIMDDILETRQTNQDITARTYREAGFLDEYVEGLSDRFKDPDSMEPWEKSLIARLDKGHSLLRSLWSRKEQLSNGESSMKHFKRLARNTLFFLDEPENSLDAIFQQRLATMIQDHVRNSNGQFIIATHSPFLMAMEGAKVIDLDSSPSLERNWYELPNMVAYYQFFQKHAHQFGKGHEGQQGEND